MKRAALVLGLTALVVSGVWALSRTLPGSTANERTSAGQDGPALRIIRANGCLACHALAGEGGELAPGFETLRGRDAAYIRRAILEPRADTAAGFEGLAGTMPTVFGRMLSSAAIDTVVEFLRGGAR